MVAVLVVGSGGRENAITYKLAQSTQVDHVYVAPGNGGTASMDKVSNVPISESKHEEIIKFCKENNIKLVAVGPEIPLCAGLGDKLEAEGIMCFGPSAKAANIEGSKAFSKDLMKKYNIPTAEYRTFKVYEEAVEYLKTVTYPVVIKASGLAAGKGVLLPEQGKEIEALNEIMLDKQFGDAGCEVVIEERLEGEECSLLCFTDGTHIQTMPPAQDHKRAFDNDQGPNTGGMGAYAPAPCLTPKQVNEIKDDILTKCIEGLKAEGCPYKGVLYAGLMLTPKGVKVLEYNCRFGDPETQVILSLLDSDLYEIMKACCEGTLDKLTINWKPSTAVTVVCASKGYPGKYAKGKTITGIPEANAIPNIVVFHSGTAFNGETKEYTTTGGRVLCVTGIDNCIQSAVKKAYEGVHCINFEGMQFRKDIAHRALARKVRIGVLGSTKGTDMQAIIDGINENKVNGEIALVLSNHSKAYILERAKNNNIPCEFVSAKDLSREAYDAILTQKLREAGVQLVLMIGYMRICSEQFTKDWEGRLLNVHPSLLPEFAGGMDANVHQQVLEAGKKTTGCTVHLVTPTLDGGPIACQMTCDVEENDTVDTLKAKVQKLEGEALIQCINKFAEGTLEFTAQKKSMTYEEAGVNITAGDDLVEIIKPFCKETNRPGCIGTIGSFGGLFSLKDAGYQAAETLLVSGDDGVGTKLKLAFAMNKHDTVGIDLVAMSVNDIVAQGAEPLFFLDYFATGRLDVSVASVVIKGICDGCKQSNCALIGGETAEMPDMYADGEYDLAGFAVGAVTEQNVLPKVIVPDLCVIGLSSTGVHSNGFSLVRRIVESSGLSYSDPFPLNPSQTLGEALIAPTKIYVKAIIPAVKAGKIYGVAHITGGGLVENIPRILPEGVNVELSPSKWDVPLVFKWLQATGNVPEAEMVRTFNCGLGMVVVCKPEDAEELVQSFKAADYNATIVGRTYASEGAPQVTFTENVFVH